jgi:peptide/nickel transport system permease protein
MRFTDLALTIPALAIAATLGRQVKGGGWWLLALIIAGTSWMSIARIIRGEFLSLREKEFVESARAIGASDRRIIFRHMLPNVVGQVIVAATLAVASAILVETALSYLQLGVKRPDASLGLIISEYQRAFATRPWLFWFPGLFIIVIALSINFIGDGLRDALDPKQNRVRA